MIARVSTMTNRDVERHYFEQFRQSFELPDGAVEYGDKPDVLLKGVRTIGIEITRFYLRSGDLPESEQKQRRLREGVVSSAQNLYRAAGGRGIELTVGFNADNPITRAQNENIAKRAGRFGKDHRRGKKWPSDPDLFQEIPEVIYVYLNGREYEDAKWRVSQVYTVDSMSIAGLERIVRNKESKSSKYKPCDAYWLLVVVDWKDPAQEQEIRIDGLKLTSNAFEKVMVYKPDFEHIVEII